MGSADKILITGPAPEYSGAGSAGWRLDRCGDCPRLVDLRRAVREQFPAYHAAPVRAWGARSARLLIVGLAPGKHGANRTGRPFTGDASGTFLFDSLARYGFSTSGDANVARLTGVRITNAVKCLPPDNRPTAQEIANCRPYLAGELEELIGLRPRRRRVVLCLGRLAHDAVAATLGLRLPGFAHAGELELGPAVRLFDTYHPSRQNTNTGRLTRRMLDTVIARVRVTLDN